MTAAPLRLLVIEHHARLRSALRAVLALVDDIDLVGAAGNAEEGLALERALQPDVVLLDLTLPGLDGLATVQRLRQQSPRIKVVVTTLQGDATLVQTALQMGANGFVFKDVTVWRLLDSIRQVMESNGSVLTGRHGTGTLGATERNRLTAREQEALRLMVQGLSNSEMAHQMGIALPTVKSHIRHVMAKLGVNRRMDAVTVALQQNLI